MSESATALAIDCGEWFADAAWRQHVTPRHWRRLPQRADVAVRLAFERLQAASARATLFLPAALAERAPELVRSVAAAGNEVGLSVRAPWPLPEVPSEQRDALLAQWARERHQLEQVLGAGVHGLCAQGAIGRESAGASGGGSGWWRESLSALGFDYDAAAVPDIACFEAWQLDREQPRLMGLPAAVRERHERALVGAEPRFDELVRTVSGAIAPRLGLPPKPVGIAPPPPERAAPTRGGAPRLAVIVPLKDEADGVVSLFQELAVLREALADVADCEFVVVDDGSTDRTWPLLERLGRTLERVTLVRHADNRGVAAAIRTGMQATDAERLASIDGDLSYDPMELRAMLPLLDRHDVVTASPYHRDGGVRNVPDWRLFLSRGLSRAYRVLLRSPICTWTSCFRLYRREAVADLPLRNEGFLGTAELLVRVLRRGGRVAEHPCVLEARLLGFSKMRVLRTVRQHLWLLVEVALRRVR